MPEKSWKHYCTWSKFKVKKIVIFCLQFPFKLPLLTEDIMDLLNLCLTLHYKQLHGTVMGLPVSVVVTEIVMQHVEECALITCQQTYCSGYATLTTPLPPFTKMKLTLLMTTLRKRTLTSRLPKKSKKMENFLFWTLW